MMTYGLTITNQNYINEKSKTKKDGVYCARGIIYAVKNGKAIYYVKQDGQVLSNYGAFNVITGDFSGLNDSEIKKKLKQLIVQEIK